MLEIHDYIIKCDFNMILMHFNMILMHFNVILMQILKIGARSSKFRDVVGN